jgi:hypothetical protein
MDLSTDVGGEDVASRLTMVAPSYSSIPCKDAQCKGTQCKGTQCKGTQCKGEEAC